jgi:hypothetical protein
MSGLPPGPPACIGAPPPSPRSHLPPSPVPLSPFPFCGLSNPQPHPAAFNVTNRHTYTWVVITVACVAGVVTSLYLFYQMSGVSANVSNAFEKEAQQWYQIRVSPKDANSEVGPRGLSTALACLPCSLLDACCVPSAPARAHCQLTSLELQVPPSLPLFRPPASLSPAVQQGRPRCAEHPA